MMNSGRTIGGWVFLGMLLFLTGCQPSDNGASETGAFKLLPAATGNATFKSTHFSGSSNCATCHDGIYDDLGVDVSIAKRWSATMMANSSRDPFWKAKLRTELNRNPHLAYVINDKCTRCHAPMANVEAKAAGDTVAAFDGGFLDTANSHHNEAMDGVSCTLCHQIAPTAEFGTAEGFSGHYTVEDFGVISQRKIYGPYSGVATGPMINDVAYTPEYGAHISDSALCASCHNLKTPFVDETGVVVSNSAAEEFPEQMPYSEWEFSAFAVEKSCQDCHMSRNQGVVISNRPMWLSTRRDNFAQHDFIGANALMLDILNSNREQLGVVATGFEETIARTEAMHASAATLAVADSGYSGGQLAFTLDVTSLTGHKLPTSYPSRRVVLHVKVTDNTGQVVFESGAIDSEGRIKGVDDVTLANGYQPHHDVITSGDQVQVYEGVMGNTQNALTYTLLRASRYLKDNRLLPRGFDKATAAADIQVVGAAVNDSNFNGGGDQVRFEIPLTATLPLTIAAELLYQPIAYGFIDDLLVDGGDEAKDFYAMYQASGYKTLAITAVEQTLN